jgi:acyl-CoA synthetase (AMP-forming)/AMP-acid ligase II
VPGVEVAVYDENRKQLDQGEHGELFIKSDMVFEGYASGEESKEIDGFLSIGDMGYLDEQGRLYVEGREDDMVVIGGENVYPAEVEDVIDGIEGVEDVAVIGMEDDEYGEALAAFVVGSVDPETVKETAERELASFKVPKKVKIVDELPRTSTGKVQKKELLEQHEDTPKSA